MSQSRAASPSGELPTVPHTSPLSGGKGSVRSITQTEPVFTHSYTHLLVKLEMLINFNLMLCTLEGFYE